jgi:hypothetical protein
MATGSAFRGKQQQEQQQQQPRWVIWSLLALMGAMAAVAQPPPFQKPAFGRLPSQQQLHQSGPKCALVVPKGNGYGQPKRIKQLSIGPSTCHNRLSIFICLEKRASVKSPSTGRSAKPQRNSDSSSPGMEPTPSNWPKLCWKPVASWP